MTRDPISDRLLAPGPHSRSLAHLSEPDPRKPSNTSPHSMPLPVLGHQEVSRLALAAVIDPAHCHHTYRCDNIFFTLLRPPVAAIQRLLLLVLTIAVNTIGLNHLLCNQCRPLWKCHGVTAAGASSRWLCLSLAVLGSTAVASFNSSLRRAVRQELTLQSQSYNNCFKTACGSAYFILRFPQITCDPGAYVYRFTVTSGTDGYPHPSVNHVNLTCSDGKYHSVQRNQYHERLWFRFREIIWGLYFGPFASK